MQFYSVLKMLALVLMSSSCVALPKPPNTPLCSFDNSVNPPHFKCLSAKDTRFEIQADSKSADKMMCTPYKDYIEMNAYYKKIFDIVEKEFLNKARR